MSIERLKYQIQNIAPFRPEEIEQILSKFKPNRFSAKDFILKENTIATDIHFICEGLVRTFYYRDGEEITTYLTTDDGFITACASLITQSKSSEAVQCIEATETLSVSYTHMQELYQQIPNWQSAGRILAEQNYLCIAERTLKLQALSAKEKYEHFLKSSPPKIVQRTPLVYIASFLGIAPETLSRIRKSIS
ncbi:MAG: cyclic nucleotide-binding domain-containing protein [Sediminibacterium sp.]|nr:cyclic nucleotide-binding domain-containing protein [Sediminibacterium sp.]